MGFAPLDNLGDGVGDGGGLGFPLQALESVAGVAEEVDARYNQGLVQPFRPELGSGGR